MKKKTKQTLSSLSLITQNKWNDHTIVIVLAENDDEEDELE